MMPLRGWIILSWTALPAVMLGGSLLLQRVSTGDVSPFRLTWLRAFHAHGGVLLLMSLLYYISLEYTTLPLRAKRAGCLVFFSGIGGVAGGFLVHGLIGQPNETSIGTFITLTGAGLLALAIAVLVYGLLKARAYESGVKPTST